MQPLGIVDLVDEAADVGFGLRERPVQLQVHLLVLQRLEEALCLGILVGVAERRHADVRSNPSQPRAISIGLQDGRCGEKFEL